MEVQHVVRVDISPDGSPRNVRGRYTAYHLGCAFFGAAVTSLACFGAGALAGSSIEKGNRIGIVGLSVLQPLFIAALYKNLYHRRASCCELGAKAAVYVASLFAGSLGFYLFYAPSCK